MERMEPKLSLIYSDPEYLYVINYLIEEKSGASDKIGKEWSDKIKELLKLATKRIKNAITLDIGPVNIELQRLFYVEPRPRIYLEQEKLDFYLENLPRMSIREFVEAANDLPDNHVVLLYCKGLRDIELRPGTGMPRMLPNVVLRKGECYHRWGEHGFLAGQECVIDYLKEEDYTSDTDFSRAYVACYIRLKERFRPGVLTPAMILGLVHTSSVVACGSSSSLIHGKWTGYNKGVLAVGIWGLEPGSMCPWWSDIANKVLTTYEVSSGELEHIFIEVAQPERHPGMPPFFIAAVKGPKS